MSGKIGRKVKGFGLLCLLASVLVGCGSENVDLTTIEEEVTVQDGVVTPEEDSYGLEVKEGDTYQFLWRCKPDHGGLITGFRLYDQQDRILLQATAEEMTMDSKELELGAGTYQLKVYYISGTQEWKRFVEEGGEEFTPVDAEGKSDVDYVFEDNGTWKMHMEYGFRKAGKSSTEYKIGNVIGLIAGIALGLLLACLLKFLIRKMGGRFELIWQIRKDSYDERQLIERGKAYRAGFYTLLIYVVAACWLSDLFDVPVLMSFGGMWLGVSLALLVFALRCIRTDAYMSLYENPKGLIIMFLVIGLLNLVLGGAVVLRMGTLLENGVLSVYCVNLETGILFLTVLGMFVARLLKGGDSSEEEDEE